MGSMLKPLKTCDEVHMVLGGFTFMPSIDNKIEFFYTKIKDISYIKFLNIYKVYNMLRLRQKGRSGLLYQIR